MKQHWIKGEVGKMHKVPQEVFKMIKFIKPTNRP